MTVDFTFCNFMFGLLLENKTSAAVAHAVVDLKRRLLTAGLSFAQLFAVFLTDNGGKFADVFSFEYNFDGEMESHLFFCDPYAPSQKPRLEKNHTLFRDIVLVNSRGNARIEQGRTLRHTKKKAPA